MQNILHPNQSTLTQIKQRISPNILIVLLGTVLIALAGQLTIPLMPVPVTLQTFAVLFVGMAFGMRRGLASVLLYLALGVIGLPVYAGLHNAYTTLYTAGYLLSYIPAVALVGYVAEQSFCRNRFGILLVGLLAMVLILLFGTAWLAFYFGWSAAYKVGVQPFILVELAKVAALVAIVPRFWR